MVIADTPETINRFQAITLKHGLKLYVQTGMKPNRMWTPKRMMALAEHITGQKFKARDYMGAIVAINAKLKAEA